METEAAAATAEEADETLAVAVEAKTAGCRGGGGRVCRGQGGGGRGVHVRRNQGGGSGGRVRCGR